MLSFKNYLIENLNPVVLTTKETTTKKGHVLPPGHPVTILRSPSESFHTIQYEMNGEKHTSKIRSDAVTLPGKISPHAMATKREKEIIAHTYRILSNANTNFDDVPEKIRPHVTALHAEIKKAINGQSISNITLLKDSRVFAKTIRDINQDRENQENKLSAIHPNDNHLIVGTDLVVHTHGGHSHYFDLKFPTKKYSYSLPSPGIGTIMKTINDIHPDDKGHGEYVNNMKKATSDEMATLTAERINRMKNNEQKAALFSHLFQKSPQTGKGYTIHRIVYQQNNNKAKSEIIGKDVPSGTITVKAEGRNLHFHHSDGSTHTISMAQNEKGRRFKVRPTRERES